MTRVYVGLGSNLANPVEQVNQALDEINAIDGVTLLHRSPWYQSEPTGPGEQPDYINGVAEITTSLEPQALLAALHRIENNHQRQRQRRWGARTLDLDILLYGAETMLTPALTIPHPRLYERNFVLRPLQDLAPDLTLPCGTPLASLLARCPRGGLRKLEGNSTRAAGATIERG